MNQWATIQSGRKTDVWHILENSMSLAVSWEVWPFPFLCTVLFVATLLIQSSEKCNSGPWKQCSFRNKWRKQHLMVIKGLTLVLNRYESKCCLPLYSVCHTCTSHSWAPPQDVSSAQGICLIWGMPLDRAAHILPVGTRSLPLIFI